MSFSSSRSPAVFICYRREDSAGHAGRLFDRIVARVGRRRVFRDVDSIQPGENFVEAVRERVAASTVLLVLIGPRWLQPSNFSERPRLADPHDLVSLEIVTALEHKLKVIPVLLNGAAMPAAQDLPTAVAPLAQLNASEIRDSHFDVDSSVLIDEIATAIRSGGFSQKKTLFAIACLICISAIGVWTYSRLAEHPGQSVAPTLEGTVGAPPNDRQLAETQESACKSAS